MAYERPLCLKELYWIAGFLEGEGSFSFDKSNSKPRISCGQKEQEPLLRLQKSFGGKIYYSSAKSRANPIYCWYVGGSQAVAQMMTLMSLMSERRREQIEIALEGWKAASCKNGKYIRQFIPKTQRRRCKKLSDEDVIAVRAADGTLREIAKQFNINRHYCFKLRKRERRTNVL